MSSLCQRYSINVNLATEQNIVLTPLTRLLTGRVIHTLSATDPSACLSVCLSVTVPAEDSDMVSRLLQQLGTWQLGKRPVAIMKTRSSVAVKADRTALLR